MVIAKRMEHLLQAALLSVNYSKKARKWPKKVGAENVYDYSLGNPSVPAPDAVKSSIIKILDTEDPLFCAWLYEQFRLRGSQTGCGGQSE